MYHGSGEQKGRLTAVESMNTLNLKCKEQSAIELCDTSLRKSNQNKMQQSYTSIIEKEKGLTISTGKS